MIFYIFNLGKCSSQFLLPARFAIRGDASAANAALDAIARGEVLIDGVTEAQRKIPPT